MVAGAPAWRPPGSVSAVSGGPPPSEVGPGGRLLCPAAGAPAEGPSTASEEAEPPAHLTVPDAGIPAVSLAAGPVGPAIRPAVGATARLVLAAPVVPPELVLRLQGYRDLGRVSPAIRRAAEAAAREAAALVEPQAVVWRGPVTEVDPDGTVVLAGLHSFRSRVLARVLASASEALVFVLTLGPRIEARVQALFAERRPVEAVLLDTAAWGAIELLRRHLRRRLLEAERARGGSLTGGLGPGHADWSVEEQPALLRVFGEAPLPVSVNAWGCLWPRKSVSGVFGIRPWTTRCGRD